MNKNEIFQFLKTLHNSDIPTMIYRETVFDIISFGKASKIHLATTASVERVKRVLSQYNPEDYNDEKDTVKLSIENDTFFIHSIFKMSYDEFVKKMVPTNLTFNSLLMKPNGQIYDMYGGLNDLKNKKLNFVNTFNLDADTHLALNCIRYIYKNNFTASDDVVNYLKKTISIFSKSEKTNALFYLVEALNNNTPCETLDILFDSDLFAPPVVTIPIKYQNIIDEIGLPQFIYALLLLLNVNVNKSRFSTMIDVSEFNEIKENFALDLSDEINYYNLKDEKGYEYLSNIIALQKTVSELTGKEFTDPIYHKQTVFDMLESSNNSIAINDENFLLSESNSQTKVQMDKKDAFSLFEDAETTSIGDVDFSSIFSENVADNSSGDNSESISQTPLLNIENTIESQPDNTTKINNETSDVDVKDESFTETIPFIESTEQEENTSVESVQNTHVEAEGDFVTETDITTDMKTSDEDIAFIDNTNIKKNEDADESDEIDSLLSSFRNNESSTLKPRQRSKNPHMENLVVGNIANNHDNNSNIDINDTKAIEETIELQNIECGSSPTDSTIENNGNTNVSFEATDVKKEEKVEEDNVVAISPPEQPEEVALKLEEQKSQQKRYNTSSVVDSIFEEEVKVKPIEMTSDFSSLVSEVADSTKDTVLDVRRKTVDENLPEDETIQKIEEIQKLQNEESDFSIDDKDLISILDELNGKKNNSGFLDDDDSEQPQNDDIISTTDDTSSHQFFTSKNEKNENSGQSQSDNDFFKSLSDDFAEIVGGNK